jgi:hypothetical protein
VSEEPNLGVDVEKRRVIGRVELVNGLWWKVRE